MRNGILVKNVLYLFRFASIRYRRKFVARPDSWPLLCVYIQYTLGRVAKITVIIRTYVDYYYSYMIGAPKHDNW